MRLGPKEKSAIKNAIHAIDPHATIFLFGSRVDDIVI